MRFGTASGVLSTDALSLLPSPPARSQTRPTIAAPIRAPATPTRIVLDRATGGILRSGRRAEARSRRDHGAVLPRPHDLRVEAGVAEPRDLVIRAVGQVVAVLDRRHDVLRIRGHHDVREDEQAGRVESGEDATEEVALARRVEMVDGECREDEVEGALRKRILEARDAQLLDSARLEHVARALEHRRALVDPDQPRGRVHREDAPGGLPRTGPQLERAPNLGFTCRLGGPLLELLVARELGMHELEVLLGVEVELLDQKSLPRDTGPSKKTLAGLF